MCVCYAHVFPVPIRNDWRGWRWLHCEIRDWANGEWVMTMICIPNSGAHAASSLLTLIRWPAIWVIAKSVPNFFTDLSLISAIHWIHAKVPLELHFPLYLPLLLNQHPNWIHLVSVQSESITVRCTESEWDHSMVAKMLAAELGPMMMATTVLYRNEFYLNSISIQQ